jgi:hypothetical protein
MHTSPVDSVMPIADCSGCHEKAVIISFSGKYWIVCRCDMTGCLPLDSEI